MRDTEVQQPNTTETLSFSISSLAFSANSGQFEAGSTTTASSFLPSTPPFLFCSSISISITSLSVVSLIAIVPDSECKMPILIVSSAANAAVAPSASAPPRAAPAARKNIRLVNDMFNLVACAREAGRRELDPTGGRGPLRNERANESPMIRGGRRRKIKRRRRRIVHSRVIGGPGAQLRARRRGSRRRARF